MLMRSLFVLGSTAILLSGCGIHTKYTPLGKSPREMRILKVDQVQVLEGIPSEPHVEIGEIEARQMSSNRATKEELYREIRKLGAKKGCDAVRIVGRSDDDRKVGYAAACIVYTDGEAKTPATGTAVGPAPPAANPVTTTAAQPLDAGVELPVTPDASRP
jgi:hypothetical protein